MRGVTAAGLAVLVLVGSACSTDPAALDGETQLALVVPAGGTVGVDPAGKVVVEFDGAMMAGMEQYMALHEGDVTGPLVPGAWSWSGDRRSATFSPAAPLKAKTLYTLHLGGGMMNGSGGSVGFNRHGSAMGGQWATAGMMGNGMGTAGSMMGTGWRHNNGTYGMVFGFTTA